MGVKPVAIFFGPLTRYIFQDIEKNLVLIS